MKFRNISPLGSLDIPFLGRTVERGEVFEVSADDAQFFVGQTETFEAVGKSRPSKKPAEGENEAPGEGVEDDLPAEGEKEEQS